MIKVVPGIILILGGCVGLLGFLALVYKDHDWSFGLLVGPPTAVAFAFGIFLIRKGKRQRA